MKTPTAIPSFVDPKMQIHQLQTVVFPEPRIPLSEIKIRSDRIRLVEARGPAVMQLADSLWSKGQLHPIILDETKTLIAGENRYHAASFLFEQGYHEWGSLYFRYLENLDRQSKVVLELEENMARTNLSWQEMADGYFQIHETLRTKNARWTEDDTAKYLGIHPQTLRRYLRLNKQVQKEQDIEVPKEKDGSKQIIRSEKPLSLVSNTKTLSGAAKLMERNNERALQAVIGYKKNLELAQQSREKFMQFPIDSFEDAIPNTPFILYQADCTDVIQKIKDESIDLILTDPIWGIDVHKNLSEIKSDWHFSDDPTDFILFAERIAPEFFRVLKDGSHLYIFCGAQMLHVWARVLDAAGFTVRSAPLIWVKNGGSTNDADRKFMAMYEPIVFATKGVGAKMLKQPSTDVLMYNRAPLAERVVNTQKPVDLLQYLISLSADPGDVVLDVMAGSMSTGIAALKEGCCTVQIELDGATFDLGRERIIDVWQDLTLAKADEMEEK